MNSSVDIVIVNWNSGALLEECISSIDAHADPNSVRSFVYDNASTDGSVDFLRVQSNVALIEDASNIGFGSACNRASESGSGEYILFLNPDARLYADSVRASVEFMENPDNRIYAVIGVRLIGMTGQTQRNTVALPTPFSFAAHALGLPPILKLISPKTSQLHFDHLSSRDVDHVIGAYYMIRRSVFEQVGGFDEDYFLYFEDLDLSSKVAQAGYSIRYVSDITAYHKENGTSDQIKGKRLFFSYRSMIIYAFKHFHIISAFFVSFCILFASPFLRLLNVLCRPSADAFREIAEGYSMLWEDLPNIFRIIRKHRSS